MWARLAVGAALMLGAIALSENQLPFCGPETTAQTDQKDLVIVSTLDGKLTAFSAEDGTVAWDLKTEPLLSSNIHHVELTSGGKWVRLVPSLSGGLYRLSAESLEALPLTADQLLSSSFKYSDELVIAGARQTSWAGVEAGTGRVVYRCGAAGCAAGDASAAPQLLVLQHNSHTLRALHPRTGAEKWNFSVAEHRLSGGDASDCASADGAQDNLDVSLTVVLPDGVVEARKEDHLLWRHQFGSPVADAWRLRAGRLQHVDVLSVAAESPASLYIGVHDQQIYIQEGLGRSPHSLLAPVPWRPRPARPALPDHSDTALQETGSAQHAALALLALYGNTQPQSGGGNVGYFLTAVPSTCDQSSEAAEEQLEAATAAEPAADQHETHHHVHVHVYSLWFWWKEVLLIAISSALLMNLMIWPRFIAPKFRPPAPLPVNQQDYVIVERHYDVPANPPPAEYVSRYATDFTPLRCLGRGGFGVVFECRNNIDHCQYAVKRITLPRRESKRARVLREVRALAKLEHENIVRYFNAWLEEPPPAWQRQRDLLWLSELEGVSLSMTEDPHDKEAIDTNTHHSSGNAKEKDSVVLNLQRPQWEQSLSEQLDKLEHLGKRSRSLSCNDSFSVVFSENSTEKSKAPPKNLTEDDSFIVFAHTEDLNHNSKGDGPHNKQLEKVKDCEGSIATSNSKKKKKTHRRHWSLDMCVSGGAAAGPEMYLYIQMQLCRRDSLHTWLRHRKWHAARDEVINIFSQIVSAVEYVHLAGLIHRDLKPSNIFFALDGKVKVGDFGLVTTMGDSEHDESSGEFQPQATHTHKVGTHLYMSPEQLRGDPYDYKVDIYSLGLILFELLQPFSTESERVACLLRLREGHFPHTFRDKLRQETQLLEVMLSADPTCRPTAADVKCNAPAC